MPRYRTEWKYCCSDSQLALIQERLSGILETDPHAGPDGTYRVHSLYFDDYLNSCAAGNESGDGVRYKYRIRYYGNETTSLHFERKAKKYGFGDKISCALGIDEYQALTHGDCCGLFWKSNISLIREFCALMMTKFYTPKAIIDYERIAFVEPVTHIRITLDRNISASGNCGAFLTQNYTRYPLQDVNQNILEVKFDEILPGWLKNMLESLHLQQTSFSKYYLGRKQLEELH